jgi:hypothetical protein
VLSRLVVFKAVTIVKSYTLTDVVVPSDALHAAHALPSEITVHGNVMSPIRHYYANPRRLIYTMCLVVATFVGSPLAPDTISALEMRQDCRGMELVRSESGQITMNVSKYPHILICYGAFITLHQAISYVNDSNSKPLLPLFLPDVCIFRHYNTPPAVQVLVNVFIRYADSHPEDGGKHFLFVAWNAFKTAWPCTNG